MESTHIKVAKAVIEIEQQALQTVSNQLDGEFARAVELILASTGRLIVLGVGKSGHIGRKLAATLASTGTPSFFVHPAEAAHGDLGMILGNDIVLALSSSGESEEVTAIMPVLKRKGTKVIAITGRPKSSLAIASDIHINGRIEKEACPLGLAPTSSTVAALALGDALAVALLTTRKFTPADFALSHPAGSLGKRLLVRVCDLMCTGDEMPVVKESEKLSDAIIEMNLKGLGFTAVQNDDAELVGIFTDGDLRRCLQQTSDFSHIEISTVMSSYPKTISPEKLASEALNMMEKNQLNGLLVVDAKQKLVGALNMHNLLKFGIV